ncbi:hypothetical protein NEMBOFW57_006477 [Staphylotrichum longicolle]|uniref:Extracellular mutant protein 11 C-terminal domain-containing protein n=1 Tax=Staphylotrichum longicolle TaxID=669026 RepID=A0AAD4ESV9_9PEZI|nr:hypothetical protein NEMBOFW57_006477 [Staphylotrichum longicolle]
MPTTKKKLGSIGLFMRQGDGTVRSGGPATGSTSNPRAVGLPVTPAPASIHATGHHTQLPQLQPPPEIIAARQERQQADKAADNNNNQKAADKAADNHRQADKQPDTPAPAPATATATAAARSIPVPRGRHAAATHPTATMSLPVQHYHPMQRTRTSASDTAREAQREQGGHNAWEDSTVASMFGDHESRAASERLRVPQGGHSRHYSDAPPQGPSTPRHRTQPKHDENLPFVIGENGILKVLPPSSTQKATDTAPATTNAVPGGIFDDQSVKQDDVYHEARQLYETPTKASGLRRTKLAYRDNRDARSNASSDREAPGYSPTSQSVSLSPERQPHPAGHIDRIRLQERLARDRERQRERDLEREREREREKKRQMEQERELQHKRSTLFENLTPLEFETIDFNDTKAAVVAPSTGLDADALKEALQRTPRANRQPHLQPHLQPQPLFASQNITTTTNNALKEAPPPFSRTGSRRLKSPSKLDPAATTTTSRKRRQSLDYNDAELHAMSYASLREQAFDFDPQTAAALHPPPPAATTTIPPTGGSLEDRLEHYRRQGSMDQHEFFTRVTVDEWDEAGDWFLEQFGAVVQRLKRARRAKRQLVARFEDEVAAREEAVRGKMEGIERTLEELKEEGQTMMEGKDVEVEF